MEVERPEDDVSKAFYLPPSDFFFHIRQRESSSPSSRVETGWDGTVQDRRELSGRLMDGQRTGRKADWLVLFIILSVLLCFRF